MAWGSSLWSRSGRGQRAAFQFFNAPAIPPNQTAHRALRYLQRPVPLWHYCLVPSGLVRVMCAAGIWWSQTRKQCALWIPQVCCAQLCSQGSAPTQHSTAPLSLLHRSGWAGPFVGNPATGPSFAPRPCVRRPHVRSAALCVVSEAAYGTSAGRAWLKLVSCRSPGAGSHSEKPASTLRLPLSVKGEAAVDIRLSGGL